MGNIYLLTGEDCPACTNVKRVLSQNNLTDGIEVVDVSSAKGRELIEAYGIRGIPTLLKLRKGRKGDLVVEDALIGERHSLEKFKNFVENK